MNMHYIFISISQSVTCGGDWVTELVVVPASHSRGLPVPAVVVGLVLAVPDVLLGPGTDHVVHHKVGPGACEVRALSSVKDFQNQFEIKKRNLVSMFGS